MPGRARTVETHLRDLLAVTQHATETDSDRLLEYTEAAAAFGHIPDRTSADWEAARERRLSLSALPRRVKHRPAPPTRTAWNPPITTQLPSTSLSTRLPRL